MYANNINDMVALQMLLSFIPVKDLVQAAMNGFAEEESVTGKENADLCFKVIKAYLSR